MAEVDTQQSFVLRLEDAHGRVVGVGLVLSPALGVTCVHVVEGCGAGPGQQIAAAPLLGPDLFQAEVLGDGWHPELDVAFLRLPSPLPAGLSPAELAPSVGREGVRFTALGCPAAGAVRALYASGDVLGQVRDGERTLLQLRSSGVTRGFSGGPVWETGTGRVIGMISDILRPDGYQRLRDVAFAIPSETLHGLRPAEIGLRPARIGGDVIRHLLQTRVPSQVFAGPYRLLRLHYIPIWHLLDQVGPGRSVRRDWLVEKMDMFFRDNARGVFVLEAVPGMGKRTFLADLVRERGYVHYFASPAYGEEDGLLSMAVQLIRAWELEEYVDLPSGLGRAFFRNLLAEAAGKRDECRPGEKIVLAVYLADDEGQEVMRALDGLPDGVYLLLARQPADAPSLADVPVCRVLLDPQRPENLADMRLYLEEAVRREDVAAALQAAGYSPDRFIETLLERCGGVWLYLHHVIDEVVESRRFPDLETLPRRLTRYYLEYWCEWRANNEAIWSKTALPLLATLAAVRESVSTGDLERWSGVRISPRVRRLLREEWRSFVSVTRHGRQVHYRFRHALLADFIAGRIKEEGVEGDELDLVDELRRATQEVRQWIISVLRAEMADQDLPAERRRDAALRLTRMDWLADSDASPAEMIDYLDLVGRYLASPRERARLVRQIGPVLAKGLSISLSPWNSNYSA